VDEKEVKVFNVQVLKLLLRNGLDLVGFVESVPQLGNNEEFFTLYEAIFESASDTLANFLLITVV
jgi:hypothetical protein